MNTKEFNEGYAAFQAGAKQSADPYYVLGATHVSQLKDSIEWLNGWNSAYLDDDHATYRN